MLFIYCFLIKAPSKLIFIFGFWGLKRGCQRWVPQLKAWIKLNDQFKRKIIQRNLIMNTRFSWSIDINYIFSKTIEWTLHLWSRYEALRNLDSTKISINTSLGFEMKMMRRVYRQARGTWWRHRLEIEIFQWSSSQQIFNDSILYILKKSFPVKKIQSAEMSEWNFTAVWIQKQVDVQTFFPVVFGTPSLTSEILIMFDVCRWIRPTQ